MPSSWGIQPRYGEYEILGAREGQPRLLGEGSFGKTFEAVRKDTVKGGVLETHVAIKVLNPALLGSETRQFQFMQELQALTEFKHPNLINCLRAGQEKGEVYYAMDLCRGGDLDRLVRRFGRLPEKVVALIALQIAAGLRELEHHRMVHRDIKPSNVMLGDAVPPDLPIQQLALQFENRDSLCRIVDFGLVDFASNARETPQGSGGTPMYASPEQIRRQPVDKRSDIYSLGMTLWFLLQGKGPLLDAQGQSVGKAEAYDRQTSSVEHDADLPRHLSSDFRAILTRMIAKQPERRFANARDLQAQLRRYVDSLETVEDTGFVVKQMLRPLEEEYALEGGPQKWRAGAVHLARQGQEPIRIIVVADPQRQDPSVDLEALTQRLCEYGELSRQPGLPEALLPVREVIRTHDLLAFTEPSPGQTSLADLLRVRAQKRSAVSFAEAVYMLDPIARALDFLLQHKRETVFLSADEIRVAGGQLADAPKDAALLAKPVTEWNDFQLAFSMVCLRRPSEEETGSAASTAHETTITSFQLSAWDLHPVSAFVRLVYRILNGSEVATATQFTSHAYVRTVTLGAASNNLLRDLLCRQKPWVNATAVFYELCKNEGIEAPSSPLLPPPPPPSSPPPTPPPSTDLGPGDKPWEVVGPGIVINPHDSKRREQEIPPALWMSSGQVPCKFTRKVLRLPPQLPLLLGRVIAPGVVQSPFVNADSPQSVPLTEWEGGAEVLCKASGRRFSLPYDLPFPEGLKPSKKGVVISPYDNVTTVEVAPGLWKPGGEVRCPAANRNFALPKVLPPLLAVADVTRPGILISPYAQGKTLPIAPKDWMAGGTFDCPVSGYRLEVPPEVEQWAAPAAVLDLARRLVSNPYRPEEPIEVEPSLWKAAGRVRRPGTRQFVALPEDLPPLVGEVDRPGFVRSPYSGQIIPVQPTEWVEGARIRCSVTQEYFVLPAKIPEWIPPGSCERLAPGRVRSPYEPYKVESVPAQNWKPDETITCSITKRAFRLPQNLPDLEGTVKAGKVGSVCSPFSSQWQDVAFEEWNEGQELQCKVTHRTFVLPAKLEEWIPDAEWVHLVPGRIRFPFKPHGEVQLATEQWKPGQVLVCPGTKFRFRVPVASVLPPLEFERDAVHFALANPKCNESEAAGELKAKHPAATAALVKTVWKRHYLDSISDRERAAPPPELILERPGVVRSPFGSHPEIVVTPEEWVAGTVLRCPETDRRCRLQGELPPLVATLAPGPPGFIISPYAPGEPCKLSPDDWEAGRQIKCPRTGKDLKLPAIPPDWLPEGTLKTDELGVAISPYREHRPVPVSGSQWSAGSRIVCQETGRIFLLPAKLPPLIATTVDNRPGVVQTPYEVNRVVPVSYRQWKPNNRVRCKATKREFLLPPTLPEWKKTPFPWKTMAKAAAVLGLAVSLGIGISKMGSVIQQPPRPTPAPRPTPVVVKKSTGVPRTITRSIFKQDGKVDYTTLTVKWKRSLPGQEDMPPPDLNPSNSVRRLDNSIQPLQLPSGVYEFTLEGDSDMIKPYTSEVTFSDASDQRSIGLPASLAGEYFGLLWTDKSVAIFLRLSVEERIKSVELQELTWFLTSPDQLSFNVTPKAIPKPEIGYRWKGGPGEKLPTIENISLSAPSNLKFDCPIFYVFADCEFEVTGGGEQKLNYTPRFPGDDHGRQQQLREGLLELLRRGVAQSLEDPNSSLVYGEDRWASFKKAGHRIDKENLPRVRAFDDLFEVPKSAYPPYVPLLQSKLNEEPDRKGHVRMWPLTEFSQVMYRVDAQNLNKKVTPGAVDWQISDQAPKD